MHYYMKYICEVCNYESLTKQNYIKHCATIKHVDNLKIHTANAINITTNAMKQRIDQLEKELKIKDSKIEEQLKLKDKMLEKKDKIIEKKDNLLAEMTIRLQDRLIITDDTTNKSVSALTFLMAKYKSAPPLKMLEFDNAKKMIGCGSEESSDDDNNDNNKPVSWDSDYDKATRKIVNAYRAKTVDEFLGTIIVKNYKMDDPNAQSIWNSDTSRLSFLIKEAIPDDETTTTDEQKKSTKISVKKTSSEDGHSEWISDKRGIRITKLIIQPLLNLVLIMMKKYIMKHHKNIDRYLDSKECIKQEKICHDALQLQCDIQDGIIANCIVDFLSPYFEIDKKQLIK